MNLLPGPVSDSFKKVIKKFIVGLLLIMAVASCAHYTRSARTEPEITLQKDFAFLKGEKITLSSIGGWPEAVGILENSLINSFFDIYTRQKDAANYYIEGNIFAKKHWRKRIYLYYTVDLRVFDRQGNIVMTIKNKDLFWQTELTGFTDRIADHLRGSTVKTVR